MKPELILRSDLLDIIFEHKNKLYGAYQLRRNYPTHLWSGVGAMMLVVVALWVFPPKNSSKLGTLGPIIQINDTIKLSHVIQPPPPKPIPIQRPPSTVASVKDMVPIIVQDAVQTEVPDQAILENHVIGSVTTEGTEDDGTRPVSNGPGTGTALAAPVPPAVEEPAAPLEKASVMPSFPGGTAALQRWLSRHLLPQEEQRPGEKVRVVVRFVVGPTGEIDRVQLVQQGGEPFDKEVLRVINKMPRWEPGIQYGHPVAVWFTIPVIFEMTEQ
jgi:periplasmic protein TonB